MRAHGEFELERDRRVITSRLKGAWNEQGLTRYREQYTAMVAQLLKEDGASAWGKLVDLRHWETSPMDLIGPYQEFQKRCVERGCVAVAFVTRLQLHRFLIDSAEFTCPVAVFENEPEASLWLGRQGLDTENLATQPRD